MSSKHRERRMNICISLALYIPHPSCRQSAAGLMSQWQMHDVVPPGSQNPVKAIGRSAIDLREQLPKFWPTGISREDAEHMVLSAIRDPGLAADMIWG